MPISKPKPLRELLELIQNQETLKEKVRLLNRVRLALHEVSPFQGEPIDCVLWVSTDRVEANDYNPNVVAPVEMELLEHSIAHDGFTQPVVTCPVETSYEVVDGFHRTKVAKKEGGSVNGRLSGHVPIVCINPDNDGRNDRIASTIRHNRARGKHRVEAMSDIVIELKKRNWSDNRIATELGMDEDEILRLCQISGLVEVFQDEDFSEAWEVDIFDDTYLDQNLTPQEIKEDA